MFFQVNVWRVRKPSLRPAFLLKRRRAWDDFMDFLAIAVTYMATIVLKPPCLLGHGASIYSIWMYSCISTYKGNCTSKVPRCAGGILKGVGHDFSVFFIEASWVKILYLLEMIWWSMNCKSLTTNQYNELTQVMTLRWYLLVITIPYFFYYYNQPVYIYKQYITISSWLVYSIYILYIMIYNILWHIATYCIHILYILYTTDTNTLRV